MNTTTGDRSCYSGIIAKSKRDVSVLKWVGRGGTILGAVGALAGLALQLWGENQAGGMNILQTSILLVILGQVMLNSAELSDWRSQQAREQNAHPTDE
jgi:high-affinity Fe2+/Pb2+ permease